MDEEEEEANGCSKQALEDAKRTDMDSSRASKNKTYRKRACREKSSCKKTRFSKRSDEHFQFDDEKRKRANCARAGNLRAWRRKGEQEARVARPAGKLSRFLHNENDNGGYGLRFDVARPDDIDEVPFE